MTKRKRTLRAQACFYASTHVPQGVIHGFSWLRECVEPIVEAAWLAGFRAGKREGKAKALKDCGWGDGSKRK